MAVACAAIVVALSAQTVARNREYASALTMWRVTVERWPHGRARLNYAAALQAAGQPDEMLTQLRLAVTDFPEARYDLGAQRVTHGDAEEGLRDLEAFVREFPTHPNASPARELIARTHAALARRATDEAIAHVNAGQLADALPLFRRAVDLMPENANVHRNLANALLDARDYRGAAAEAREALQRNPTDSISRDILLEATRR
jgi:predicted Zn-dependent protease